MKNDISFLKIAALQAENLLTIKSKKSKIVKLALKISEKRQAIKKNIRLLTHKFFRKTYRKPNQLRILVDIRGGIGDVAMTRIFMKKLREHLPLAEILLSYDNKEVVDLIFSDNAFINGFAPKKQIHTDYDVVLEGCHALVYKHVDYARVKELAPNFIPALVKGLEMTKIFNIINDNTPFLDGYLANFTVEYGSARVANLGLSAGIDVGQNDNAHIQLEENGFSILDKFGLANKKYITIHNGINPRTRIADYSTRSWTAANWKKFITMFKEKFPSILTVHIGAETSEYFDFTDVSLLGKTAPSDLPYLLEKSLLHIDGESGMVHLANLLNTVSIVMFGPSPMKYLAYKKNINIQSPKCVNCMCISKNWMSHCILGFSKDDACLAAIQPEIVMNETEKYLNSKNIEEL